MVTVMSKWKKIGAFLLVLCLIAGLWTPVPIKAEGHTDYTPEELLEDIEGILLWEKSEEHLSAEDNLLDAVFLQGVGNSSIDWLVFGMGRSGYPDDYSGFQAVAEEKISSEYQKTGGLDREKATEWHRMALAILAAGGDPTAVGADQDGNPINLVVDGVYDMQEGMSPGKQGINGWIFGLLTLDSLRYQVPEGAAETRESILISILEKQLADGGFSLNASTEEDMSDVDLTAMAIQALAPYYNSEQTYTYERMGRKVTQTVRQSVDEALKCLSDRQLDSGGFISMGFENSESCSQVITALCSLGIDPGKDERFIKDGHTVLDALMSYQQKDGGFLHSREYDEENPEADPDASNLLASGQACYALTALCRYYGGLRTLYDFREEPSQEVKEQITQARAAIQGLGDSAETSALQAAYEAYLAVPVEERSYVYEYADLAEQMKEAGLANDSEYLAASMEQNTKGNGTITSLFGKEIDMSADIEFSQEDAEAVKKLPETVTTENYVEVVKLLDKLNKSENQEDYEKERGILQKKKEEILKIQEEIADINNTVLEKLYPLEDISREDKKTVEDLQKRIAALSEYDRQEILQYEDIREASVRIKNQETALMVSIVVGVLIVLILLVVFLRMRKRRAKRLEQRRAVRYDAEDDEDDDEDDEEE